MRRLIGQLTRIVAQESKVLGSRRASKTWIRGRVSIPELTSKKNVHDTESIDMRGFRRQDRPSNLYAEREREDTGFVRFPHRGLARMESMLEPLNGDISRAAAHLLFFRRTSIVVANYQVMSRKKGDSTHDTV
jgi:hypothetical protein